MSTLSPEKTREIVAPRNMITIDDTTGRAATGGREVKVRVKADPAIDVVASIITTPGASCAQTAADLAAALRAQLPAAIKVKDSANPPIIGAATGSADVLVGDPLTQNVRVTVETSDDPTQNVLVTLHEVGHALYSQGHPTDLARTLAHASPSLGAEESQARFYENHVGRELALWEFLTPTLRRRFGAAMDGIDGAALHRSVSQVTRGWCRVDADELTYDLHIALRFSLELALIRGTLDVVDLPDAWNDGMERLLGVRPDGNRQGCMQDIHWAWGSFGYFPTYTLGNIYAAQIREALEADLGPIPSLIQSERLSDITAYLHERIHSHGSILSTGELMLQATGQAFSVEPFLRRAQRLAAGAR